MVEVIVDDINKYTLDEPVSIQKGQTFQIKNKSDSRKYFLFISLINTSKKKWPYIFFIYGVVSIYL